MISPRTESAEKAIAGEVIPADVMEAAREVAKNWRRADWNSYEGDFEGDLADDVARAIMAERERLSSLLAVIEAIAEFGPTEATQVIAQRILHRFKAEQPASSTPNQEITP